MSDFNEFNDVDSKGDNVTIVDAADPSKKVKVTNNQLSSQDIISTSLIQGVLSVTSSPIEIKVGASRLTNRKGIWITANATMYWGADNTVTTTTGQPIAKDQTIFLGVGDIAVYLVCSGTQSARIIEGA
jgi:hypothetical protein